MATLKELIAQRIDRLDSVPANLQTAIEKQQERVFKQLLTDLKSLEIVDGKYIASKENLGKIAAITEQLKKNLFNKDYLDAIKTFALEIQTQAKLTNQIMGELGDFTDKDLYNSVVKKSQQNALLLLDESAIAAEVVQPLADLLSNSIISNVGYLDAVESLRTFMVGNSEVSGKLSSYAGTYVKDAFAVSDRQYAKLVADDMDFEFYEWSGGVVKGSRYFCCVRHGNIYHKKEIEEWGRDASFWDKPKSASGECGDKKGGGRNPNTNETTIFSYAGGYGCVHVLIPVATKYVPKDVIARAAAKGYYSPPEIDALIKNAQKSGEQIDKMAKGIADKYGAKVTPISYKSRESILRKANSDYGGDVSLVNDAVRNTIVADKSNVDKVFRDLSNNSLAVRSKQQLAANDPLGYSGYIVNVRTKSGINGEIQVNTAKMIYAKQDRSSAEKILGTGLYDKIAKETGLSGGLGHKFYEEYRLLNEGIPSQRARMLEIEAESKKYYSNFY